MSLHRMRVFWVMMNPGSEMRGKNHYIREREDEHLDPRQEIVRVQRGQLVDRVQHEETVAVVLVEQMDECLHALGHERRALRSQVQQERGCSKNDRAVDRLQLARGCLQQSDQIWVHFIPWSFIGSFIGSFSRILL